MSSAVSIKDAIDFIRAHNALEAWSDKDIALTVHKARENAALAYNINEDGKLKSICFGRWESKNTIYIMCLIGKGELKHYISYLKRNHPECRFIKATRYGKLVIYKIK